MTNEPVISSSDVKDIIRGLQEQTIDHISLNNEPISRDDREAIVSGLQICKSMKSLVLFESDALIQNHILYGLSENKYVTDLYLDIAAYIPALESIRKLLKINKNLTKLVINFKIKSFFRQENIVEMLLDFVSDLIDEAQYNRKLRSLSVVIHQEVDDEFTAKFLPKGAIKFLAKSLFSNLESNFYLTDFYCGMCWADKNQEVLAISFTDTNSEIKGLLNRNQKLWDLIKPGEKLSEKGEFRKAMPHFDAAIQLASEFSYAWLEKAKALCNILDFSLESLQVTQRALQLNSNNEDAQRFYKQILLGLKRTEAIKIVEQVVNAENFPKAVKTQLENWRMVIHSLLVENDNFSSIVLRPQKYPSLVNLLISKLAEIINKKYAKLETTSQLALPRVTAACEEVVVMKIEEKTEEIIKVEKQEEVKGDKADENKQLSPKASKQFHQGMEKLFNSSSQLEGALEQKKKQFSERLQSIFTKAYTAADVINKNDAEVKKDSTDKGLDYVDQANYVTGSIIGVEGTLLIKGITASIRTYRNFTAKQIAFHISQLANDPVEMQKLIQKVSEEIADKYEQQIAQLTPNGITTLVECTALRMIQYIGSNEGVNSTITKRSLYWMWGAVVSATQGTLRVINKSFAPEQEPLKKPAKERLLGGIISGKSNIDDTKLQTEKGVTDPNDPWFAAWVLARTGIVTEEGEYFSDADCKPEKYGYRRGTKTEADTLGYKPNEKIEAQPKSGMSN